MKLGLYSIYDKAAMDIGPIFEAKTLAVAQRQFRSLIMKTGMASEYELVRLGFLYKTQDDDSDSYPSVKLVTLFEVVDLGESYDNTDNQYDHVIDGFGVVNGGKKDE